MWVWNWWTRLRHVADAGGGRRLRSVAVFVLREERRVDGAPPADFLRGGGVGAVPHPHAGTCRVDVCAGACGCGGRRGGCATPGGGAGTIEEICTRYGVGEVQAGDGVGRGGRGGEWREGGLGMRGRGARSTTRQRRARQQVSHGSWWHEHRQWRPRCQVLASAAVAAAPATVAGRARATDGGGGGTAPRRPRSGESGGDEEVADGSKGGGDPGHTGGPAPPGVVQWPVQRRGRDHEGGGGGGGRCGGRLRGQWRGRGGHARAERVG